MIITTMITTNNDQQIKKPQATADRRLLNMKGFTADLRFCFKVCVKQQANDSEINAINNKKCPLFYPKKYHSINLKMF